MFRNDLNPFLFFILTYRWNIRTNNFLINEIDFISMRKTKCYSKILKRIINFIRILIKRCKKKEKKREKKETLLLIDRMKKATWTFIM